jgi:hypothetical protein
MEVIWPSLRYESIIFLKWLTKTTKILSNWADLHSEHRNHYLQNMKYDS